MRLVLAHLHANVLELFRQPGYWVPTVALPFLFFVFFGISAAQQLAEQAPASTGIGSEVVLTQFLLFGIIGVVFFQFGVGIAEERRLPWETTLRLLPLTGGVRFGARVLTALVFSVASTVPVFVLAALATTLRLAPPETVAWLTAIVFGAVPFGLMGIFLGYAATPKAALPIANIGFLLLSFGGGLFVPLELLPGFVAAAAPFLPTRHWLDLALATVGGRQDGGGWLLPALYLAGWTVLFGVLTLAAYRRDEGVRYG